MRPATGAARDSPGFLEQQQVPVLVGVDTRAITRKLRNYGVLQGVIVPADMPEAEVQKLVATPDVHDQVRQVTTSKKVYTMGDGPLHVAVMDFGIKRNILNYLNQLRLPPDGFPGLHQRGRSTGLCAGRHLPEQRSRRS
jgi:carbamoylphosphate synthase small subunit